MSTLPDHLSGGLTSTSGRDLATRRTAVPARVLRAVDRAVAVEHGRGIVQAARVRAVEYVAHEALSSTAHLSQLEAFYSRQAPHAAARLQAIADLAAMNVADIVAETGRG